MPRRCVLLAGYRLVKQTFRAKPWSVGAFEYVLLYGSLPMDSSRTLSLWNRTGWGFMHLSWIEFGMGASQEFGSPTNSWYAVFRVDWDAALGLFLSCHPQLLCIVAPCQTGSTNEKAYVAHCHVGWNESSVPHSTTRLLNRFDARSVSVVR